MTNLPRVLIVGGSDVDARLELMNCLSDSFDVSALGSLSSLHDRFRAQGFGYTTYRLGRGANPVSDLSTLGQLLSVFCRIRPHVVHTFDTKPGVWGRLAARLAGVPIVIGTLPGLGALYANHDLKSRLVRSVYQPLQRLACHFSDLTIFQNRDDAGQFIAARVVPERKTRVIFGSGVLTDLFAPGQVSEAEQARFRRELGLQPNELIVTMVSRVIRSKGVLEYAAAARDLGARYSHVRFLLVGPDDNDGIDRLTSAELGQLKQNVVWPGPRQDIPTVLAVSDVFVFPSAYREGVPRVLLEAASMGLPIVTTDSPGCSEVVEDGVNGFRVPARDTEALAEAVLRLIVQPELRQRFGRVSRQRAVEYFDLSKIADQTRAIYHDFLERKGLLNTGRFG
jgi:glycosyltransferase involved in cell wall biosynthesis